ncbi:O-methyltransferase [Nesterenkonia alkaliphila]|uniref:Methyltransferase domain-containing protein n=1 Tax=Nesterenkonia alkaliphila TaxID=1463631 RepID=A0A7K1UFA0_9MICC|nr:O-methyltransferase [Nesterenkonia alkaliphila]MVT25153.1 methyltransferase domain-containing protein [Nesterenkonia alkaliphila]GFZ96786.1 O-methyltransferase [Nesterenkonia alkaliphila]
MSAPEQWAEVDRYFIDSLVKEDPALAATRESSGETLFPGIDVAPNMGAFLGLLVQLTGAKRILEIGTLAGYSAIWMARAAGSDAQITTCELEATNAKVAQENFEHAGVADRVQIRRGPAAETLQQLIAEQPEPFDLVFIDADKRSNPTYLKSAVSLSRPGTAILIDNTVRQGQVVQADSENPDVLGTRQLIADIAADGRLTGTALQTVGLKGWDGFTLVRVS